MTKTYGKGRGEETMWESICVISKDVEMYMPEEGKDKLMRDVYGTMSDGHYNEEYAIEDVEKMYYIDAAGKEAKAPYWTEAQVKDVYESVKSAIPASYNFWDFYVVMQMLKSDLCPLYKKWFPNDTPEQMDKRFIDSSVNWLNDKDSPHKDDKIWSYLND